MIHTYIARRRSHGNFISYAGEVSYITHYDETEQEFIDRVVDETTEQGDNLVTVQCFTGQEIDRSWIAARAEANGKPC